MNRRFLSKIIFSGLEIEGNYVKFAQAQDFAGKRRITRLIVKKLPSESENDIITALKGVIEELKGQVGELTLCIPRHKVTVRFLRFPSVSKKEIDGMVKLQSAKELPLHKEEIISDYFLTEQTRDGYTKVALVIVHKDIINQYLKILKKANLEPQRATFSTEAIRDWYRKILEQEKSRGNTIFFDLDCNNLDIAIFSNSYLDFTRGLTIGAGHLGEHPELNSKLVQEIKRTIEGYGRQEKTRRVQRILLGETAKQLKHFLEEQLNLPCTVVAPLKGLSYEKKSVNLQYQLETSLVRILGVVLQAKARRLNLLPQQLRQKHERILANKRLWKISLLVLTMIVFCFAALAKKVHDKNLRLFYIDREIRRTGPLAREVENMLKKIEMIENRGQIAGSSVDILSRLHKLTPRNISLSTFSYNEETKETILQGNSTNRSEVFEFIDLLEKSDYFQNVQLKYAREKKTKYGEFIDFRIESSLE